MADTRNPAGAGGTNRVRKTDHAAELITSEHTLSASTLQQVRAAWLMRRVPLSPQTALFVASLHFGEAAP